jgi:glycosyltransferase involved in cell wall biosynthesis
MKKFSLIIPVYKQEKTIKRDILAIIAVLEELRAPFEIIPVIDGYLDKSLTEAKKIRDTRVKPVGYRTNHGKGYAVRFGFAHAEGDIIGFMDAGGDLKPKALLPMLAQFEFQDADAVIGSKRHPDSKIEYPIYRRILSWGYQWLTYILFGINVRDTQVGMKIYKRKLLEEVLPRLLVKKFAFDIEMLAVANHLGYSKIYEAPIELNFAVATSSITFQKILRTVFNMMQDTLAVFYRLRIRKYYDNSSKRKWRFDPELNFKINVG